VDGQPAALRSYFAGVALAAVLVPDDEELVPPPPPLLLLHADAATTTAVPMAAAVTIRERTPRGLVNLISRW
jgi:hypothetical protein